MFIPVPAHQIKGNFTNSNCFAQSTQVISRSLADIGEEKIFSAPTCSICCVRLSLGLSRYKFSAIPYEHFVYGSYPNAFRISLRQNQRN
jgi:hypothetical protein